MSRRRLSGSSFPNVLSLDEGQRETESKHSPSLRRHSSIDLTSLKSSSVVSLPPLSSSTKEMTAATATASPKAKKWKGSILSAVKPINEASEKRKFLAVHKASYNPQFVYKKPLPSYVQERFGNASDELLNEAVFVLRTVLKKYGSFEKYEEKNGGRVLSDAECIQCARKYLRAQGITEVRLAVLRDLVPHAHMTRDKRGPILEMKSGVLREYRFEGLLNHEIGTHYLRARNEKFQPWFCKSGRKLYGLLDKNPTEEGLASLHSVLQQTRGQYLFRSALLYYAASRALTLNFVDLFQDLTQFVSQPDARWNYCVRVKRGIRDTSKPGSFSKDQVYFKGALQILKNRREIDFCGLFLGKIAWQDVARLKQVGRKGKLMLPAFMRNEEKYREHLEEIMSVNGITDEKLHYLDL